VWGQPLRTMGIASLATSAELEPDAAIGQILSSHDGIEQTLAVSRPR